MVNITWLIAVFYHVLWLTQPPLHLLKGKANGRMHCYTDPSNPSHLMVLSFYETAKHSTLLFSKDMHKHLSTVDITTFIWTGHEGIWMHTFVFFASKHVSRLAWNYCSWMLKNRYVKMSSSVSFLKINIHIKKNQYSQKDFSSSTTGKKSSSFIWRIIH